jgi:hypothetical protein
MKASPSGTGVKRIIPKAIVLLCGKCNLGSGYFHDSPALLRSMADINEFLAFAVLSKLKE